MSVISRYTRTAIALHWLIAVMIGSAFTLGLIMSDMPGLSMAKLKYYSWHKWMGVTIFILALLRVMWRATHSAPPLAAGLPAWQRHAASATHLMLYVLIIVIPLTGYFYSLAAGVQVVYLGIIPLPVLIAKNEVLKEILKSTHSILNFSMAGLIALHALGALKHYFIDRDGTLARMLPFLKQADRK